MVGQRIHVKLLEKDIRIATAPVVVRAGKDGYAVLFGFGVIVLFNVTKDERKTFVNTLQDKIQDPVSAFEYEETKIIVDPTHEGEILDEEIIYLKTCEIEHLQLIAVTLAKSVYLSYYETKMAALFDLIEPMAAELHSTGRTGSKARSLLRHIGQALSIEVKMIGLAEVAEKPGLLWENPGLDRFYGHLNTEYELHARMGILKKKLDLAHNTTKTILSYLQDRRILHVEWYIVFLILFEVILTLSDKM